jgi:hypothetical protein
VDKVQAEDISKRDDDILKTPDLILKLAAATLLASVELLKDVTPQLPSVKLLKDVTSQLPSVKFRNNFFPFSGVASFNNLTLGN